ncbi:hypothetical protein B0H13DRAFT_1892383 [Mycena leptocephala]|nr:hypothetical protein B0H13DRAFT_1892383 [Mycena leptocephala]
MQYRQVDFLEFQGKIQECLWACRQTSFVQDHGLGGCAQIIMSSEASGQWRDQIAEIQAFRGTRDNSSPSTLAAAAVKENLLLQPTIPIHVTCRKTVFMSGIESTIAAVYLGHCCAVYRSYAPLHIEKIISFANMHVVELNWPGAEHTEDEATGEVYAKFRNAWWWSGVRGPYTMNDLFSHCWERSHKTVKSKIYS